MCSKRNPSLLRKSGSDDMENFSLPKLSKEWKEKGTPFFSFLMTRATVKEKGCDWTPAAVVAGSTVLKSRNMHMNATASLISVMIRQSGTQVFDNDILVLV